MRRCPQGAAPGRSEIPTVWPVRETVWPVREPKSREEVAAVRLRSVLAGPAPPASPIRGQGAARETSASPPGEAPFGDLAGAGGRLRWSDIIPAWPDDVDLDPVSAPASSPGPADTSPDAEPSSDSASASPPPPGDSDAGLSFSPGVAADPSIPVPAGQTQTGHLEAALPSTGHLEAALPSTGQPEAGLPSIGQLEAVLPSIGQLEAVLPPTGQLEAVLPPTGQLGGVLPSAPRVPESDESVPISDEVPAVVRSAGLDSLVAADRQATDTPFSTDYTATPRDPAIAL